MSPEERKLLEELVVLTRDNQQILKELRRAARWRRVGWWTKWVIIIILSLGAYYYIEPWLKQLIEMYQSLLPGLENVLPR